VRRLTGTVPTRTFGAGYEAIKRGRERGWNVYQRRAGVYCLRMAKTRRRVSLARLGDVGHTEEQVVFACPSPRSGARTDRGQVDGCLDPVRPQAVHVDCPVRLTVRRKHDEQQRPGGFHLRRNPARHKIGRVTHLRYHGEPLDGTGGGPLGIDAAEAHLFGTDTFGKKRLGHGRHAGTADKDKKKHARKSPSPRGARGARRRAVRRVCAP
jgi:hypothetical protein